MNISELFVKLTLIYVFCILQQITPSNLINMIIKMPSICA